MVQAVGFGVVAMAGLSATQPLGVAFAPQDTLACPAGEVSPINVVLSQLEFQN